jgi:SAM-dependent methyltransferase
MPSFPKERRAPGWKASRSRLIALIVLLALDPGIVRADGPAQERIEAEMKEQDKIYSSRGADVLPEYVTYRALSRYAELLPSGFTGALARLGGADRWLDVGAGRGQAILDYFQCDAAQGGTCASPAGKARAVAVSIEDRRTDQWRQRAASLGEDRIRYLHGKRLRDYSREELGTFRIITDVYGGFTYTDGLSLFMLSVLELLETGGDFYTLVQGVRLEDGRDDPKTSYYTELVDAAGRDVKVCSWLKSISCVQVVCESKSAWETPTELIHVRKVCDNVRVPPLRLLEFRAGVPPGRWFQLEP